MIVMLMTTTMMIIAITMTKIIQCVSTMVCSFRSSWIRVEVT